MDGRSGERKEERKQVFTYGTRPHPPVTSSSSDSSSFTKFIFSPPNTRSHHKQHESQRPKRIPRRLYMTDIAVCSVNADVEESLCIFSWQVYDSPSDIRTPCNYLAIFDLNQWYQAQMPSAFRYSSKERIPFLGIYSLAELAPYLEGSPLVDVHLVSRSLARFSSLECLEEHNYPSSLSFQVLCFSDKGIIKGSFLGMQRQVLAELSNLGPLALLDQQSLYQHCKKCALLEDIEPYTAPPHLSVQETQREQLLTLALVHGMFRFLTLCLREWAVGDTTPIGLSTEKSVPRKFRSYLRQLETLTTLFTMLPEAGPITEKGRADLRTKLDVTQSIAAYLKANLLLTELGNLPQSDYPTDHLKQFYVTRRRALSDSWGPLLMADRLWKEAGRSYPPESLEAGLAVYLQLGLTLEAKHRLFIYLLIDLQRENVVFFPDTLLNGVRALWHLDHGNFQKGVELLMTKGATQPELTRCHQEAIVRALMRQGHSQLALQLCLTHRLPCTSQEHVLLQMDLLLNNQSFSGAFLVMLRIDNRGPIFHAYHLKIGEEWTSGIGLTMEISTTTRMKGEVDQRRVFGVSSEYDGAVSMMEPLLRLPLDEYEERELVKFLTGPELKSGQELLVLYFLQKSRPLEVARLVARLPNNDERCEVRRDLISCYLRALPQAQKNLALSVTTKSIKMPAEKWQPRTPTRLPIRKLGLPVCSKASLLEHIVSRVSTGDHGKSGLPDGLAEPPYIGSPFKQLSRPNKGVATCFPAPLSAAKRALEASTLDSPIKRVRCLEDQIFTAPTYQLSSSIRRNNEEVLKVLQVPPRVQRNIPPVQPSTPSIIPSSILKTPVSLAESSTPRVSFKLSKESDPEEKEGTVVQTKSSSSKKVNIVYPTVPTRRTPPPTYRVLGYVADDQLSDVTDDLSIQVEAPSSEENSVTSEDYIPFSHDDMMGEDQLQPEAPLSEPSSVPSTPEGEFSPAVSDISENETAHLEMPHLEREEELPMDFGGLHPSLLRFSTSYMSSTVSMSHSEISYRRETSTTRTEETCWEHKEVHTTTQEQRIPAAEEEMPAEIVIQLTEAQPEETESTEIEAQSVEIEAQSTEIEAQPVETDAQPVETEAQPMETEASPAEIVTPQELMEETPPSPEAIQDSHSADTCLNIPEMVLMIILLRIMKVVYLFIEELYLSSLCCPEVTKPPTPPPSKKLVQPEVSCLEQSERTDLPTYGCPQVSKTPGIQTRSHRTKPPETMPQPAAMLEPKTPAPAKKQDVSVPAVEEDKPTTRLRKKAQKSPPKEDTGRKVKTQQQQPSVVTGKLEDEVLVEAGESSEKVVTEESSTLPQTSRTTRAAASKKKATKDKEDGGAKKEEEKEEDKLKKKGKASTLVPVPEEQVSSPNIIQLALDSSSSKTALPSTKALKEKDSQETTGLILSLNIPSIKPETSASKTPASTKSSRAEEKRATTPPPAPRSPEPRTARGRSSSPRGSRKLRLTPIKPLPEERVRRSTRLSTTPRRRDSTDVSSQSFQPPPGIPVSEAAEESEKEKEDRLALDSGPHPPVASSSSDSSSFTKFIFSPPNTRSHHKQHESQRPKRIPRRKPQFIWEYLLTQTTKRSEARLYTITISLQPLH
ncbi:AHCTF1 [Cordylochernes scorpioides]|uniref:AHCTF1 n=1 Tax=Cordylochernes scorpioides TaxID=51811 RepID=A0ABY6KJX5_9ARAC|nr:AHCTF1 [Cordylochernes scorpioides]